MPRLNIERQNQLEPKRMDNAVKLLNEMGYSTSCPTDKCVIFSYKGQPITLWPYSGYFSGKTVIAGRGLQKLLKQLKPNV